MSLREDIDALIVRLADGSRDDDARDALLARIGRWQAERVSPYGRLVARHADDAELPGLPTDVFRFARVASFPEAEEQRAFLTSGTTHGARGRHPFRDLSLYLRAAEAAARFALFPDRVSMRLIMLHKSERRAPESSLSFMLSRFESWFGDEVEWVFEDDALDVERLALALARAVERDEPVALLGTSFAFVHAEDALADRRFALPAGSRVMQTGGFKGRSREVDKDTLIAALGARYGVPTPMIVAEYGMTELSSQLYEPTARHALRGEPQGPRRYWVPGWVRARVLDPESLAPLPDGEVGVLRIDDPANLDSVSAVVTSDLARIEGGEVELLGRASDAVARGCSLAIEEALS